MDIEASRMDQVRTGLPPHRWTKVDDPEASRRRRRLLDTVIAGGGPAGLTAAYELTKHGHPCVVLEADPTMVGGISRTDQYKGYRFDIGGHRFFSKSDEVNAIWREILGDQFITRSRMSRIYYDRKFFHYPLKPVDALLKLGPSGVGPDPGQLPQGPAPADPARAELRGLGRQPLRPPALRDLLQDLHREGLGHAHRRDLGRLGRAADQGAEPDQGRLTAPSSAAETEGKGEVIKTLIDSFQYPRLGPGQMWEAARDQVRQPRGRGPPRPPGRPDRARRRGRHRVRRPRRRGPADPLPRRPLPLDPADPRADPLPEPAAPRAVVEAAESLKYRDFLTVVLIVDRRRDLPRQLDLHPRARRPARPRPELQELVARPRARPVQEQPRARILLLRGRRPLDHVRRRADRARPPRDRRDRPGQGRARSSTAASSGCPRRTRSTTTSTRTTSP